jgi:hypothetical protein
MKFFSFLFIPLRTALDFCRRTSPGMPFHALPEMGKWVPIMVIALFLSQEYFFPSAQSSQRENSPQTKEDISSPIGFTQDPSVKEILNLAAMIRFVTNHQLPEGKALRYAGLIFHASQKYGVNPPEIIALIMAESQFKESSINAKSGDYGLGQINWKHWGKDYGLSRQELLDPAINIYMTCHVYKYFGKDFGKYHRGFGIKSKAYVVNVKSILSSLHAFAELDQEEVS